MGGVRYAGCMEHIFSAVSCLSHASPAGFPEQPGRVRGILARLAEDGRKLVEVEKRPPDLATAVAAVHDPAYLERFRRAVARGDGLLDSADNPLSSNTWDAAWSAAGAAVAAADWVASSADRQAFAVVRPPGHHAERSMAMGFCYLANVSVAAQRLIDRHGCGRVAIVDFDVHHGNGTQHIFEARDDVLVINLHQFPFYPGTGAADEQGVGAGIGATVNVPLAVGTGDEGYREAFESAVLPALRRFAPEVVLVSAGFDAWRDDPLGGMNVSESGFGMWGTWLRAAADESCGGRLVSVLEGGYDQASLPGLVATYLDGVQGRRPS